MTEKQVRNVGSVQDRKYYKEQMQCKKFFILFNINCFKSNEVIS